jgi:hypothetical protein
MGSSDIRIFFSLRVSGENELQHSGRLSEDAVFCKVLYTVYIYPADKQTLTYTLLLTLSHFLPAYRVYIAHERMSTHAKFFLTSLTAVRRFLLMVGSSGNVG